MRPRPGTAPEESGPSCAARRARAKATDSRGKRPVGEVFRFRSCRTRLMGPPYPARRSASLAACSTASRGRTRRTVIPRTALWGDRPEPGKLLFSGDNGLRERRALACGGPGWRRRPAVSGLRTSPRRSPALQPAAGSAAGGRKWVEKWMSTANRLPRTGAGASSTDGRAP